MIKLIRFSIMFIFLIGFGLGLVACAPNLLKISVDITTIQTEYYQGQAQETYENAIIYAHYEKDKVVQIENLEDVTFSTISTAEVGEQTLTITYRGKSENITITVREKLVTDLTITGLKSSYVVNEVQNNDCTIIATYEDGSTETVNLANVTFSTISTEEVNTTQKITATYKGFSKEVPVIVSAKLISISLDQSSIITEYYQGQAQENFANAVVYATYLKNSNNSLTETILITDTQNINFSTISTANLGTQTLTITYNGKTTSTTITVREKAVTALTIVGLKVAYLVGDVQDNTCTITATYEDGSTETVNLANVTFSTISTEEVSTTQKITVSYKGFSKEVPVSVSERPIEGIRFVAGSINTTYEQKDTFEGFTGAQVVLVYEDQTTEPIAFEDLVFTPNTISTDTIGNFDVIVYYGSYTDTITFSIIERTVKSINLLDEQLIKEYFVGDSIENYNNLQVEISYTNNTSETVFVSSLTDAVLTTPSTTTAGTYNLTLTYKGFTDIVEINIIAVVPVSINIITTNLKTSYFVGDLIENYNNLKVKITYNNGTNEEVLISSLQDAVLTTPSAATAGTSNLKLQYEGLSNTVEITIQAVVPTSISIINSDLTTFYTIGDAVENYNNLTAHVVYNNGKEEEVLVSSLTDAILTTPSTDKVGVSYLTLQYEGLTTYVKIFITKDDQSDYYFSEWAAPEFVTTYKANIAINSEDQYGFYVNKNSANFEGYVIGDDNPFKFKATASAYLSLDADESIKITDPMTYFEVYIWNTDWVKLTDNIDFYVEIDEVNASLDFTENAIGKKFKVSALPYFDRTESDPITFEFTVKDGYNVYKAEELSLYDNVNFSITDPSHEDYKGGRLVDGTWKKFKQDNGLWGKEVNGLFIHTNLKVDTTNTSSLLFYQATDADLPSDAQCTYGVDPVGSYRDFTYAYQRITATNKPFEFNGNYFTIDASAFPLIAFFDGGNHKMTHASLFYTKGEKTSVTFKNTKFIGNAQRKESGEEAGGLILSKNEKGSTANFENLITLTFGITYYSIYDNSTLNMIDCKSYDNYSNIIYSFGKTQNNVTHCYFNGCGGPIAILAHNDPDKDATAYGTLNIDETSTMINFVTGGEAWFQILGANTIVTNLKPLAQGLQQASTKYGLNKTFIRTREGTDIEEINLIAVVMHELGPLGSSSSPIKGSATYGDSYINLTNEPLHNAINQINSAAPIMQAGGKTIFFNGSTFKKISGSTQANLDSTDASFFMDDFVGLSVKLGGCRTGVLLGFFDVD